MRAVRLTDQGLFFDRDFPKPVLAKDESIVRVSLAGVCSTDLELVKGYYGFRGVLGHEFVGEVEQSSSENWIGRRVVSSINFADTNSREFAEFGLEHHPNRTVLGIVARDGAMADYVAIPTENLYEVPANVSDESAVFAEPLAAALRIAEQIALKPSHSVAVLGPGRLGMLVAQVMSMRGAQVTVAGRSDASLTLARELKLPIAKVSELSTSSFHVVVDCTGSPIGLEQAIRVTRPHGTLVLKSTYEGIASINFTKIVVDEIQLQGSRCGPIAAALRLLARQEIEVERLIDARFAVDDVVDAFQLAAQPGIRKVLLNF